MYNLLKINLYCVAVKSAPIGCRTVARCTKIKALPGQALQAVYLHFEKVMTACCLSEITCKQTCGIQYSREKNAPKFSIRLLLDCITVKPLLNKLPQTN